MRKIIVSALILVLASCVKTKEYTIEVTYNDRTVDTIVAPSDNYPSIRTVTPDYGGKPVTELATGAHSAVVIATNVYKFKVLKINKQK